MVLISKKFALDDHPETLNSGDGPADPTSDTNDKSVIKIDNDLVINLTSYSVSYKGNHISFPKKEFELLWLLATNPFKVFRRDEILQHVWGEDYRPKDSRSLDVHIRMIRKKLNEQYITTIRGVGYKLVKV